MRFELQETTHTSAGHARKNDNAMARPQADRATADEMLRRRLTLHLIATLNEPLTSAWQVSFHLHFLKSDSPRLIPSLEMAFANFDLRVLVETAEMCESVNYLCQRS